MNKKIVNFIRDLYSTKEFIPLHAPVFIGNESDYVNQTLQSTFVSSVGGFVDQFETAIADFTKANRAVAVVNGTAAIQTALYLAGVKFGELVVTQSLTFVATCNAISHVGAEPVFVDISAASLGLCPQAFEEYLSEFAFMDDQNHCMHQISGQRIRAVVPMHTFGHPVELDELSRICKLWNVTLIEDAAESLGSFYKGHHTGTIGDYGALSFNGNKIITTGGGGMLLCKEQQQGERARHLTTTAKVPHSYEFYHDELGFNFRMPNINAALGCAQLEKLAQFVELKRSTAMSYEAFFKGSEFEFVKEPIYARSNYWLNAIICPDERSRNSLLTYSNSAGVMTRPVWTLMHKLPMFKHALKGELPLSEWAESRLVNIPSSVTGV
jgi:aminotransferase in exopolysaccharide biosynthesis